MKKFFSILCLMSMLSLYQPVLAAVTVPANTSIFVIPKETVTSKNVNQDIINTTIQNDVIIHNTVVFRAGDKATLNIGEIDKARCWGKPGQLLIVNGYAYDAHGQKHKVILTKRYTGEEKTWPKVMGGISIFFLFPLALFGFVHGGQAIVSSGTELEVNLASQFVF